MNKDFGSIFSTLLPGANAKLAPPQGCGVLEGLEFKVALGNTWKENLSELSGGQRSVLMGDWVSCGCSWTQIMSSADKIIKLLRVLTLCCKHTVLISGHWWPCPSFWPCCCSNQLQSTSWMRWMLLWIFLTHRTLGRCCAVISDTHRSIQHTFDFKKKSKQTYNIYIQLSPCSLLWCPWRMACSPMPTSCSRQSLWTACPQCHGLRSPSATPMFPRKARTRLVRRTRGTKSSWANDEMIQQQNKF